MDFMVRKADLVKELQLLQGIAERRNAIPILSNVLLDVGEQSMRLSATDLDVSFYKFTDGTCVERLNVSALKPGTFARVHITSSKVDSVLTLPYAALQYRYGVNRVFVVNGDKLAMRELSVGERVGDRIEILGGVKAGERIGVTDVDTLNDGAAVSITR